MLSGIAFFLDGLLDIEEEGIEAELDITAIAKAVIDAGTGASLLEKTRAAATAVVRKADVGPARAEWIEEHDDDITDFGRGPEAAWTQFQEGRIEALRLQIQDSVLEEIDNLCEEAASSGADDEDEDLDDEPDETDEPEGD